MERSALERLIEVRWHGRGGQGAVTASNLLAEAALEDGKYFQAFPEFGAERSGAPITAYTRISPAPIHQHSQVTEPDAVVVLDPTLIGAVDFLQGLKQDGVLAVNTSLSPGELRERLGLKDSRVYTLDATRLALDTIGRNIPNTPMMGALLRALPLVSRESVLHNLKTRMGRLGEKTLAANIQAFERGYRETREG